MYNAIIHILILLPLAGFILVVLSGKKKERLISGLAFTITGLCSVLSTILLAGWLWDGQPVFHAKDFVLYEAKGYTFFLDFLLDKVTMTYLMVGSILVFLIMVYSKYYMHREEGYKRFFTTVMLFYLAYMVTIFSGNFETLFTGWEFLGISSFLLIAFYRDRYLPVRNAVKVFAIYRIGDVGILLAMWASHHFWHQNITFYQLSDQTYLLDHIRGHEMISRFIAFMILLAAVAKSAQFPFSSWLPRAMEGPTPSSAIFYGSLSVHFGVFLLMRTYSFWDPIPSMKLAVGIIGGISAIGGTLIARVQSSIKSQIAYASIAQIGIIFIELAMGWLNLALIHFAGNAFLRTYQLLVSPSIVSYLIREQFYEFKPHLRTFENTLPKRIENSTYILGLKEWNLDLFVNRLIFKPMKILGARLGFLSYQNLFIILIPTFLTGMILWYFEFHLPDAVSQSLPELFAFIGLLCTLKSFSENKYPRMAWILVMAGHFWTALAVSFNERYDYHENILYLSGITFFGAVGFGLLEYLRRKEKNYFHLGRYFGHVYEYPVLSGVFFVCALGTMAFPISTSFMGEDIVFSHIHSNQFLLALFSSLIYIMGGISLVRIYARLFLGPHCKNNHSTNKISN